MKILLVNQCFWPDVVATAQHSGDLARALAGRGHEVTVIAGSRGYDDPALRFPAREKWHGVEIRRVPSFATGKGSKLKRGLNIASFFSTCFAEMLTMPRFDVVIALTSPPLISALAAAFVRLKGGRLVYWIMDLNPDEAIAAGWLEANSAAAKVLDSALRFSAKTAGSVIALDRFMRDRMLGKGLAPGRVATIPPWSHDHDVRYSREGREAFRARHGLTGKFVVMYSGNHSPVHPLDTVMGATLRLASRADIAFCFVGGGSEQKKVKDFSARHGLTNVLCLPYQPLAELSASLSSADVHLVVLGAPMAGLVHPCKIYNVMAIGVPVLFVGPRESHVGDIAGEYPGLPITIVDHGDVEGVVRCVEEGARGTRVAPHEEMRKAARSFSADALVPRYTAVIEAAGAE